MVAILGIASVASLQIGSLLQRRAAEEELLRIGSAFQNALIAYSNATPPGQSHGPRSLDELLKDPRYPGIRRYLRQLYVDPLTGKSEWGVVESPENSSIIGVFSLSEATPIKIANFESEFADFTGKTSYRDWQFIVPANLPH
ncbi:type II secretion system protein [Collimonas humicola]|uniref:type II secretion system protein n=1 Tax=Collimonas humicola TaxID=2825886 RepID=UPI001E362A6E|nr:type II secretion system protein [Collimonas humicola]